MNLKISPKGIKRMVQKYKILGAIDNFLEKYPDAAYGPAHIVLDDYNLSNHHIKWCLSLLRAVLTGEGPELEQKDIKMLDGLHWYEDRPVGEFLATKKFLLVLLSIPEDERIIHEE